MQVFYLRAVAKRCSDNLKQEMMHQSSSISTDTETGSRNHGGLEVTWNSTTNLIPAMRNNFLTLKLS